MKLQPSLNFIERTTPSGVITEFPVSIGLSGANITAGPDGNLWFTSVGNIGRITTSGVVTVFPTPAGKTGRLPGDITAGPDGNLWFTDQSNDAIGRITPTGMVTEFSLPPVTQMAGPFSITAGPDGNLWFTRHNAFTVGAPSLDQIGRITPSGTITLFAVTPGSQPQYITAGSDGVSLVYRNSGQPDRPDNHGRGDHGD